MSMFLILAIYCFLLFVPSQSKCPEGWAEWRDEKCYSLHANFLSYKDAQQVCTEKKGLLATIREEAQQKLLTNYIHNVSGIDDEVWLGATRVFRTRFKWEDGSSLDYTNWAPGNPSGYAGRNCAVMVSRISHLSDSQGKWRDSSCTRPNYFVCEREPDWSPEEVLKVLLENRKKLYNLVENPVPIGFMYTQLPGQPDPTSLWPNIKWTEISEQFAGKFFRVVGGAAGAFGTTQNGDSPRLTNVNRTFVSSRDKKFEEPVEISQGAWSRQLASGHHKHDAGSAFALHFFVSNPEVRPVNTAMRIWVRTS